MSSNIKITRICTYCNNEFIAKTTVTKYCSPNCNKKDYKNKLRLKKIANSNLEKINKISIPYNLIKQKDFLTVKETSILLNCSRRTIYNYINEGLLKSINISKRMIRIKRSDIDSLFKKEKTTSKKHDLKKLELKDCYKTLEIYKKYNVSESSLYAIVKRNKIGTIRKGKYLYISKNEIDRILA